MNKGKNVGWMNELSPGEVGTRELRTKVTKWPLTGLWKGEESGEKRKKRKKTTRSAWMESPAVTWLALSMLRAGVHGLGLRQRALTLIAKKPNAVLNKLYKKFSRKHYNPQLCSFEVFLVYSIMQSLWEQSIHESKHGFHLVKTRQYKIRKKVY